MAVSKDEKAKKTPANPAEKPAAVKKPAVKIAAEKPAAPKKAAAVKKPAAKKVKLSPEERYRMVEVAAYYIAERSGFKGSPGEFWAAAEEQIGKLLDK